MNQTDTIARLREDVINVLAQLFATSNLNRYEVLDVGILVDPAEYGTTTTHIEDCLIDLTLLVTTRVKAVQAQMVRERNCAEQARKVRDESERRVEFTLQEMEAAVPFGDWYQIK